MRLFRTEDKRVYRIGHTEWYVWKLFPMSVTQLGWDIGQLTKSGDGYIYDNFTPFPWETRAEALFYFERNILGRRPK